MESAAGVVAGFGRAGAADDGNLVRLTHTQLPGDLRPIHDEGWTAFLDRLIAAARGKKAAYPPWVRP